MIFGNIPVLHSPPGLTTVAALRCEVNDIRATTQEPIEADPVTTVISSYIHSNFPLATTASQYTPFQLGCFLNRHVDTYMDGVKISAKKIINFHTVAKLIPVG